MTISNTQYAVTATSRYSKTNSEDYWEIELIDKDSGALRKTYVSELNFNFRIWEQLLTAMQQMPDRAIGIQGNFKTVRGKSDIINADAKFEYSDDWDRNAFMNAILETYYPELDECLF